MRREASGEQRFELPPASSVLHSSRSWRTDMAKQIQDAYIVAATRTPVGKAPRGMFKNVRPDDMLAYVLKAALGQMPRARPGGGGGRDRRLRHAGSRAGHERGAHRAAARGLSRQRLGHDHQPLLLVGRAGGGARGGPHTAGRGRRDDRRRHREHEHGADGRQQADVQPGDLREGRERRDRLRHGHHRREGRGAVEGEPRGAGHVRRGEPPPRDARDRHR